MDTPVLFLIYNRTLKTERVFSAIRKAMPKKLFISADGPKDDSDLEACNLTRKITEKIDWDCEVKRLYRDKNLGLKKSIEGSINWFFENVDEGMILEDDCLPNESFFDFCTLMLSRYREDEHVMLIRGDNPVNEISSPLGNYYLSKYIGMWGWATWKRSWKLFDGKMNEWPTKESKKKIDSVFDSFLERLYWHILLDATYRKKTNSWGYRWMYSVWKNNGKIVTPCVNLVKNIGFKGSKTHFVIRSFEIDAKKIEKPYVEINDDSFAKTADKKISAVFYGINPIMVLAQFTYYFLK